MKVLVTGGTRGLGRAIVCTFLRQGDQVAVNYLKNDDAYFQLEKVFDKTNLLRLKADVRDRLEVKQMFEKVKREWGHVDILINNAGITLSKLLPNTQEQDFEDVFSTNMLGPVYCINEIQKIMKEQKDGHIINISSINGLNGGYGLSVYSMAKAALVGYTKQKAKELGKYNIRVNVVIPGFLETDLTEYMTDKAVQRVFDANVLGKISNVKNVAEFLVRICEEKKISGQIFNLDSRIIN